MKPEHRKIGEAFVAALHEELGADDFKEMRRRQIEYGGMSTQVCASHDFCDPNQIMIDVMTTHGKPMPSGNNDEWTSFVNEVWKHAKRIYLDPDKTLKILASQARSNNGA